MALPDTHALTTLAQAARSVAAAPVAVWAAADGALVAHSGFAERAARCVAALAPHIAPGDLHGQIVDLAGDPAFAGTDALARESGLRSLFWARSGPLLLLVGAGAPRRLGADSEALLGALARLPLAASASDTLYQALFESSSLGILVIGLDGTVLEANRAADTLLSRRGDDLTGRTYHETTRGTDQHAPWEPFEELASGQIDHYPIDKTFSAPGGRTTHARLSLSLVRDQNDVPQRILCTIQDVTAERLAEADLQRAKERAEVANRTKSAFLAAMSHELRTPLNSVIGFTNVLLRSTADRLKEQETLYLQRVRDNGMQLLELINDILDLSKIEADRVSLDISDVDVADLVRTTTAQLEGRALGRDLDFRALVPDGERIIQADPAKLRQILINLIGNALKFTEHGHVHVALTGEGALDWAIEVRDSGIGIPPDRLESIFEAFEQADGSVSRKFGGTGLGLAISRRLAELMGLRISVSSIVGTGTTFRLERSTPSSASADV